MLIVCDYFRTLKRRKRQRRKKLGEVENMKLKNQWNRFVLTDYYYFFHFPMKRLVSFKKFVAFSRDVVE